MQWRSRTPKSTRISNRSLESVALVEARRLRVHRESKRTGECRARKFPSDRKVVGRCTRFAAIAARAPLHVRVNRRVAQTRSIQVANLLHTRIRCVPFAYDTKRG